MHDDRRESWDNIPYHDQKAIMKPNHEKKNVRPYVVEMGLKKGIDRAFWLTGLTSGARQRSEKVSILKDSPGG